MKYAFRLGRNPEISLAELGCFLGEEIETAKNEKFAFLKGELPFSTPQKFLNTLGGCVEVIEIFEEGKNVRELEAIFTNFLKEKKNNRFALNLYPESKKSQLQKFLLPRLKKNLRREGIKADFMNKNFQNVTGVMAVKQKLIERGTSLAIIDEGEGKVSVGFSVALQDFEAYSKRDYEKPFRNPATGMLPPKLAQIIVNMGTALLPSGSPTIVVDPFCGTGTILTEALLIGYSVIGSDNNPKMVEGTKKNIDWLRKNFSIAPAAKSRIFQKDATEIEPIEGNIAIVTEPYLGPPLSNFPHENFLGHLMRELSNLYIKFFQNLAKCIVSGTKIIFISPYWKKNQREHIRLSEGIIDKIEKLGYSKTTFVPLQKDSLFYDRQDQIVGREIVRFIYSEVAQR